MSIRSSPTLLSVSRSVPLRLLRYVTLYKYTEIEDTLACPELSAAGCSLRAEAYTCVDELTTSDHSPVFAEFLLKTMLPLLPTTNNSSCHIVLSKVSLLPNLLSLAETLTPAVDAHYS